MEHYTYEFMDSVFDELNNPWYRVRKTRGRDGQLLNVNTSHVMYSTDNQRKAFMRLRLFLRQRNVNSPHITIN